MTVSGAYGRDYKSLKAAQEDWDAHKDFVIRTIVHESKQVAGRYINKGDAEQFNITDIWVRYDKDRKIGPLK